MSKARHEPDHLDDLIAHDPHWRAWHAGVPEMLANIDSLSLWTGDSVVVTTPNALDASPHFARKLARMWREGAHGFNIHLPFRPPPAIKYATEAENRNDCVARALEKRGCRWVLLLDSDALVDTDTLDRLLAHGVEGIVGAWFLSHDRSAPICVPNWKAGSGRQPVEWTGISCMLIPRQVFKAIPRPWFQSGTEWYGWQDKAICLKATIAGFRCYVDTDTLIELEDRAVAR